VVLIGNYSRKEGVAFTYSVKLVKYLYTSTHLFRQYAKKVEKREPTGKATQAKQPNERKLFLSRKTMRGLPKTWLLVKLP